MYSSVYLLAFQYSQGESHIARLMNVTFTDDANKSRYLISLQSDICKTIAHIIDTEPSDQYIKYISNSSGSSPLLLVVPASHNKIRLEVDVSHINREPDEHATLVIHKSYGEATHMILRKKQMQESLISKLGDASKIPLSELAPEDGLHTVIVNDAFNRKKANNTRLNLSVWRHCGVEFTLIFSFQVWVENNMPDSPSSIQRAKLETRSQTARLPSSVDIGLMNLRKAFTFNIHDGPEFRTTLAAYEQDCPKLKKAMLSLQDEVLNLESSLKRLLDTRNRILEALEAVISFLFSPLLKKLEIHENFSIALKSVFKPFERNLTFIVREIFALQSMPKMISICLTSTGPDGSYEPASSRKSFEKLSKEFYDWLHKYLSNEKDRPELKLLFKRKAFELSKFVYLNALNASSNNQYFNQLLENLFKFSNLPKYDGVLDFRMFKDRKRGQSLLSENASLYLNGLSRFNSEKLQFRQMIEACRTNEELTNLIKSNSLNSFSAHLSDPPNEEDKLKTDTSNPKLDEIFPISPLNLSPLAEAGTCLPWKAVDDDQNANFAGILYALGGQGKPGWHKEWVVLQKGQLMEYSDWRNGTQPINRPIDIALASVKPITKDKRQFCLEIITSTGQKHIFQAINDDERSHWIKALYNAGQLTDRLIHQPPRPQLRTDIPKPPTQILPPGNGQGSPVSVFSESLRPTDDNFLQSVRSIEGSENGRCADCKTTESTEWISMTFLVVICVKCSSCHRNMGSHISKVKSLKLDNFLDESRVLLKHANNSAINAYLEAISTEKLVPEASDTGRLSYIRLKYEQRAFMAPSSGINALLVNATRRIDVDEVIKWLNCGADPNLSLQMSTAHSPDPLTVTLFEYSLRKIIQVEENGEEQGFFVISELLLLHGCDIASIDALHPRVVGTEEAKTYWMKKRARAMVP